MTRNKLGNDPTVAGASYAVDSDDDFCRHKSPDSYSNMTKSGWFKDNRFVPKTEAATKNDGDGDGASNAMLVYNLKTIPEASYLDRTDEEAGSWVITTSAKHAMNNPHHESSSNEDGSDSWEERESKDHIPQRRNSDDQAEADAGSCVGEIGESGLGDSPYVLVQRNC